jgi:hypothetical protein
LLLQLVQRLVTCRILQRTHLASAIAKQRKEIVLCFGFPYPKIAIVPSHYHRNDCLFSVGKGRVGRLREKLPV